jgi:hypothetical protein
VCPGGSQCTNGCCQSCGIFGSCTTQADCGGSNQCVSGCCVLG